MKAAIYDNYGIYPTQIDNLHFNFDGREYFIFLTETSEEETGLLVKINEDVQQLFPTRAATVYRNKRGRYLTDSAFGKFLLISLAPMVVSVRDLITLHQHFRQGMFADRRFRISDLGRLWEERFAYIEEQAGTLRSDANEYNLLLELLFWGYGMAENAIGYLADIKATHGDIAITPTLAHLRLGHLDPLLFFNPLNFYLDHSCRDIVNLYKGGVIDLFQLESLIVDYQYNQLDASLLMARLLFPSDIFDYFAEPTIASPLGQKDQIENALLRIRQGHLLLVNRYGIRPIGWLLNERP